MKPSPIPWILCGPGLPPEITGESVGAKEGGVLSQVTNELNVEALPMEVPEHIDADVSALELGDSLRLSALTLPQGVTALDDADTVIATVTQPMREEEPEEAEAAEGEEGAAAEGEEAAEADGSDAAEGAGDGDAASEE